METINLTYEQMREDQDIDALYKTAEIGVSCIGDAWADQCVTFGARQQLASQHYEATERKLSELVAGIEAKHTAFTEKLIGETLATSMKIGEVIAVVNQLNSEGIKGAGLINRMVRKPSLLRAVNAYAETMDDSELTEAVNSAVTQLLADKIEPSTQKLEAAKGIQQSAMGVLMAKTLNGG